MLEVITPAADRTLLSVQELRAAASVSNASSDAALAALGDEIAVAIARACNVAVAGASVPTLRSEVVRETFRLTCATGTIVLSRRPVTAIASITLNGEAMAADGYEFDAGAGLLYRLDGDNRSWWMGSSKVVVTYTAGYADVPVDIRMAAKKMVTEMWAATTRDPNLKRVVIEGIGEREYWVPPTTDPLVSSEVMDLLAPYRNVWVA